MSENTRMRARLDSEDRPSLGQRMEMTGTAGAIGQEGDVVMLKRDKEFWYEDGSVILTAGDTEFRVFKGILADHSPFFRDMFSLPQPPNTPPSPTGEQCPVVPLTDSPNEVRHLLRACIPKMGPDRYGIPPGPTYDEIASSIRLGHKYQFTTLVDSSIAYLKRFYTDNFETWSHLGRAKHPPRFRSAHAIGVLNLARLTGCLQLLPSALLTICCLLPDDLIFNGVPPTAPGDRTEKLSIDDIRLCYNARPKLAIAEAAMLLRICHPDPASTCRQPQTCRAALGRLLSMQHKEVSYTDPSRSHILSYTSVYGEICRVCYAMVEERDISERRAIWKKLPELFGIVVDGWAAGNNADEATPQAAAA